MFTGRVQMQKYLEGSTNGVPNREIALEELLLLWITNKNPAALAFHELFDDSSLKRSTSYKNIISALYQFFSTQPGFVRTTNISYIFCAARHWLIRIHFSGSCSSCR